MKLNKDQRRQKKLKERDRSKRDREHTQKLRSEFPEFVFDETESHANPAFVAMIKESIRQFRFSELHPMEQTAFKDMREYGAEYSLKMIQLAMDDRQGHGIRTPYSTCGDLLWMISLGEAIFAKIAEVDRKNFLPINNVRFNYRGQNILVQFYSLLSHKHNEGTLYYSRRNTKIEFNGQEYIVAFSKEAILKLGERTVHAPLSYRGVGEFFAFMDLCLNYEPCLLRDDGPAFTFYDYCIERTWSFQYVTHIVGKDNYNPASGKPYYRVGYCPTVFVDERFALAKTLLFPGFSKTPEYKALHNSRLPYAEKERLKEIATHSLTFEQIQKTLDFSALKWFHENGVPQVIQTEKKMFHVYGKFVDQSL